MVLEGARQSAFGAGPCGFWRSYLRSPRLPPHLGTLATVVSALMLLAGPAHAEGPSFDCAKVEAGSIETLICGDAALSAADRKMAEVYRAASAKAGDERPPVLKAEQRGWIKGRDECWKSEDRRTCIAEAYQSRIAELQALYRLVPSTGAAVHVRRAAVERGPRHLLRD
jgi:uncharacterized protein